MYKKDIEKTYKVTYPKCTRYTCLTDIVVNKTSKNEKKVQNNCGFDHIISRI